jgi:predicted O-methyltransferase YrrM
VLWRSLAKAPFEMLGDLDRWREPTLDSDAEVIAKGLGLFYIRRRSDDLAQVVPSNNAELFSVIQREVRAGDTVIDAGANIGAVTVYLASRVGPTGNVLAIEMIPKTATCLRTNVELN